MQLCLTPLLTFIVIAIIVPLYKGTKPPGWIRCPNSWHRNPSESCHQRTAIRELTKFSC